MKGIELPVFHYNDQTSTLSKLDIETNFEDNDIKMVTFYNINGICISSNNGKDYGMVLCNGDEYITPMTYNELKLKLSGYEEY